MHKRLIYYQFYNSLSLIKENNSVRKKLLIQQKKETENISRVFLKLFIRWRSKNSTSVIYVCKYWYIQIQM